MIAYTFHKRYSFKDFKKVGVAIYANGVEDLNNIYRDIGHYPDFIHVDIIDKTMKEDAEDVKTYRMETMKAYWPHTQIQTHIMSYEPSKWLEKVLPYSDVIYIHAEGQDDVESLLQKIGVENMQRRPKLRLGQSIALDSVDHDQLVAAENTYNDLCSLSCMTLNRS